MAYIIKHLKASYCVLLLSMLFICIAVTMPFITTAQSLIDDKHHYDIKIISTHETGSELWTCYEAYDGVEMMFYDCVISDSKASDFDIKSLLRHDVHNKYSSREKSLVIGNDVDKGMECWEYSNKLGD